MRLGRRALLAGLAGLAMPDPTTARLALRAAAAGARDRLANRQDAILGLAGDGNGNVTVPGTGLVPVRTLTGGRLLLAHNPSGRVWTQGELVEAIPLDDRAPLGYRVPGQACRPYSTTNHIAREWMTEPATFTDPSPVVRTFYLPGPFGPAVNPLTSRFHAGTVVHHDATGDLYIGVSGGTHSDGQVLRLPAEGGIDIYAGAAIATNANYTSATSVAVANATGYAAGSTWYGQGDTRVAIAPDGRVFMTCGTDTLWRASCITPPTSTQPAILRRMAGKNYQTPFTGPPTTTGAPAWLNATWSTNVGSGPPAFNSAEERLYLYDAGTYSIRMIDPPINGDGRLIDGTGLTNVAISRTAFIFTGLPGVGPPACSPNGAHTVFHDGAGAIWRVERAGGSNGDGSIGAWSLVAGVDTLTLPDGGSSYGIIGTGDLQPRSTEPLCYGLNQHKVVTSGLAVGNNGAVYFTTGTAVWKVWGGRIILVAVSPQVNANEQRWTDIPVRPAMGSSHTANANGRISVDAQDRLYIVNNTTIFGTFYSPFHAIRIDP